MRLGIVVPVTGAEALDPGVVAMGVAAEAAGADGLWVGDHLLMLDREITDYPYSPDGRVSWDVREARIESLTACAFLAAHTTRCRIGTAALVLPQRNALEVAKVAASLDRLSAGRLALGVGTGWNVGEMEALGYEASSRGKRMDEMLQVLRACWSGRPPAFAGEQVTVPAGVILSPTPRQPGGPPLLVGGMAKVALRRAARHGDGWLASGFLESDDLDGFGAGLAFVRELATELERPRPEGVLQLFAEPGREEAMLDALPRLAALGFDELATRPPWEQGIDAAADYITRLRTALEAATR